MPDVYEQIAALIDPIDPKLAANNSSFRATVDAARRLGREEAARAIVAHADKVVPMAGHGVPSTHRRHLMTAAQVAAAPITHEQVLAALDVLTQHPMAIVCHLDEAGHPIDVEAGS